MNEATKSILLFAENDVLQLSFISDCDKDCFFELYAENEIGAKTLGLQSNQRSTDIKDLIWENFISEDAITLSIRLKSSNEFIGYCMIKHPNADIPELGIDLLSAYRCNGYGTAALELAMSEFKANTGKSTFCAFVAPDNVASQAMFKKLGATPSGIALSKLILSEEHAKQFASENLNLIDDHIEDVAKLFGVDPIDLLGHSLVYKLYR